MAKQPNRPIRGGGKPVSKEQQKLDKQAADREEAGAKALTNGGRTWTTRDKLRTSIG